MDKRDLIQKLLENPGYLKSGSKTIAQRFGVTRQIAKEAVREAHTKRSPKAKIKRLFFDIETSPNVMLSWKAGYKLNLGPENIVEERKIICICYKWEGEDKVQSLTWDNDQNDKTMLELFSEELIKADEVIGHNCVTTDTKILKNDLSWIEAKDLKIGDELVGFDEGSMGTCRDSDKKWKGQGNRKYKSSIVTGHEIKKAFVKRVKFDDGSFVDVTEDHQWLSLGIKDNNYRWRKTSELSVGYRCPKPFDFWEVQNNYNSGYISGMIDADGTVSKDGLYSISIYQSEIKNKDICNKLEKILKEENIEYTIDTIETSKIISTTYKGNPGTVYNNVNSISNTYRILGTSNDKIEIIGRYNIQKGIRSFSADRMGFLKTPSERIRTIVSIETVGEKDIVVMQTSEKTFIANGYLMHNCDKYDIPWVRTRCLYHGIQMLPDIKSLDTLKKVRGRFLLNSNKLDYLGQFLGVGKKQDTGGFDLWKSILLDKDPEALKKMVAYCKQDVNLLEQVYNKITNYIKPNTHAGVLDDGNAASCPNCGSINYNLIKPVTSPAGALTYQLQCTDCNKFYKLNKSNYQKISNVNL